MRPLEVKIESEALVISLNPSTLIKNLLDTSGQHQRITSLVMQQHQHQHLDDESSLQKSIADQTALKVDCKEMYQENEINWVHAEMQRKPQIKHQEGHV